MSMTEALWRIALIIVLDVSIALLAVKLFGREDLKNSSNTRLEYFISDCFYFCVTLVFVALGLLAALVIWLIELVRKLFSKKH